MPGCCPDGLAWAVRTVTGADIVRKPLTPAPLSRTRERGSRRDTVAFSIVRGVQQAWVPLEFEARRPAVHPHVTLAYTDRSAGPQGRVQDVAQPVTAPADR